jgi:hypothetical protein
MPTKTAVKGSKAPIVPAIGPPIILVPKEKREAPKADANIYPKIPREEIKLIFIFFIDIKSSLINIDAISNNITENKFKNNTKKSLSIFLTSLSFNINKYMLKTIADNNAEIIPIKLNSISEGLVTNITPQIDNIIEITNGKLKVSRFA